MTAAPERVWWTVDQLLAAGLPDLPGTKRGINIRATDWRRQPGCARRREGRGGGWEYHWTVLPVAAQNKLLRDAAGPTQKPDNAPSWAAFDALPEKTKQVARDRLEALLEVETLHAAGVTHVAAVNEVAARMGASQRTLYNWIGMIEGVPAEHRLAALAPRHRATKRAPKTVIDPAFLDLIKSDWLRLEQPSLASCYDRAVDVAKAEGIDIVPIHSVRRWIAANVSKPIEIARRKGMEALKRYYPHQTRDKSAMRVLECVQGDYHKFDVFVSWPPNNLPVRVQMVAFSDVYSGRILSYRLALTANSHTVQLAIGDIIERFGIPESFLLDNGREFAAKSITGGTETRFRFKIKDDDIPGLIPLVGAKVIWATPYSGQSKPIERAFRDLCDRVARHPAFVGAYTGNRPDAKPENYASRAIDIDAFRAVLAREIERHNARPGRRSEVAFGRSFDEVFEEGFKTSPIRRATEEQRRLWLLSAVGIRAKKDNGELALHGNRYWSEWMYRIEGTKVVARFDPDALHDGVHVYDLDGSYLGFADCLQAGGFLSVEDAREHARRRQTYIRKTREAADAEVELTAAEIAARVAAASPVEGQPDLEPSVIQITTEHEKAPKTPRGRRTEEDAEAEVARAAQVTSLTERLRAAQEPEEGPEDRFERAEALAEALEAGQPVTPAQRDFLADYRTSAEYAGRRRMHARLGKSRKEQ